MVAAEVRFVQIQVGMNNGMSVEAPLGEMLSPTSHTVWKSPEGPHAIANVGPVPVRFMRIEMKPEACAK